MELSKTTHTKTVEELFAGQGISMITSTYQSNRVITTGYDTESQSLVNQFHDFKRPMGMGFKNNILMLGHTNKLSCYSLTSKEFSNTVELKPDVTKANHYFVPTNEFITGDVDIHEIAFADSDVFFVNTRYNAVCKPDILMNWVPVWRPEWITNYDYRDRCHLNGLCTANGKLRYATAVSQSNEPMGWKNHKRDGGVIIDIQSNEIVCDGLSMPHSPRVHRGNLYVCDSGNGTLLKIGAQGEKTIVAKIPGFARGLSFFKNIAAVGVSKVRETNVFGGLEITKSTETRNCGVYFYDINTGEEVGYMKFDAPITEIFSVNFLPGTNTGLLDVDFTKNYDDVLGVSINLSQEVRQNMANFDQEEIQKLQVVEKLSEKMNSEDEMEKVSAKDELIKLVKSEPDNAGAQKLAAQMYLKEGNYTKAFTHANKVLKQDALDMDGLLVKLHASIKKQKKTELIEKLFRKNYPRYPLEDFIKKVSD